MKGTDKQNEFNRLLCGCKSSVERYVKFKVNDFYDSEDVLQEIYLAAFRGLKDTKTPEAFKAWIIGIARNKVNDYYRKKAKILELPIDSIEERAKIMGRCGVPETQTVREALSKLADRDKRILYMYYFKDMPQQDIADSLKIPIGTVKSRLHTAKAKFKKMYPYRENRAIPKGESNMTKEMPLYLPEYTIEQKNAPAFKVRWEELMGWFIVPREGEKLKWAMYDFPERKRSESVEIEALGKAEIHGIEGVEIIARTYEPSECNQICGTEKYTEQHMTAQLTDTHCRILAESHIENGVKKLFTFLDGDEFIKNWGFGEDNCGNEVNISPKGLIKRDGNTVSCDSVPEQLDVVGRYTVNINGRSCDTVCVMDIEQYNGGTVSEQFIDKNGRTVLWRRYNKNDWMTESGGKLWTERLPDNERLYINGETYVHWYDCITDYIL